MSTPEQWKYYYERSPMSSSLDDKKVAYHAAIDHLTDQVPFLPIDQKKRFLLGGFYPCWGTVDGFLYFCRGIHPNSSDIHIFTDMNIHPLQRIGNKNRVQARLEDLPFTELDVVFLDFVTEFMSNGQLKQFSRSANRALARNGVILITKIPQLDLLDMLQRGKDYIQKVPLEYPRSLGDFRKLTKELKLVYLSTSTNRSHIHLIALSRQDSDFPVYKPAESEMKERKGFPHIL